MVLRMVDRMADRPMPRALPRLLLAVAVTFAAALLAGTGLLLNPAGAAVAPALTPAPSTSSLPNTSPFPPPAPTNLTATPHAGSITLTWTASTPGCCAVTGYDIHWLMTFDDVVYTTSVGAVTTATLTQNIR